MIFVSTKLGVADNSGAKIAKCIKIYGLGFKKIGHVGDLLLLTIKKAISKNKIKKKTIYHGLIVMVKQYNYRKDGSIVKFNGNRVLLFMSNDSNIKFLGSRVYGPLMKEIKFQIHKNKKEKQKYFKVLSYSKSTI